VYGWRLSHLKFDQAKTGALAAEAQTVYEHIRAETAPDALIAFGKPRFIALKTGRQSVRWFEGRGEDAILDYFRRAGVDYVLVGPPAANRGSTIEALIQHHPTHFAPTFDTEHFRLYRFAPPRDLIEGESQDRQ
jgi:hypothetical protein